ncbi:unnamed protein product [Amoebophrya sp. A25]|nr:unnamed protein product [Amoebophrya sp. A25]|eukprot:GSA25T00007681001.1
MPLQLVMQEIFGRMERSQAGARHRMKTELSAEKADLLTRRIYKSKDF